LRSIPGPINPAKSIHRPGRKGRLTAEAQGIKEEEEKEEEVINRRGAETRRVREETAKMFDAIAFSKPLCLSASAVIRFSCFFF
jgi:hypothetical protein